MPESCPCTCLFEPAARRWRSARGRRPSSPCKTTWRAAPPGSTRRPRSCDRSSSRAPARLRVRSIPCASSSRPRARRRPAGPMRPCPRGCALHWGSRKTRCPASPARSPRGSRGWSAALTRPGPRGGCARSTASRRSPTSSCSRQDCRRVATYWIANRRSSWRRARCCATRSCGSPWAPSAWSPRSPSCAGACGGRSRSSRPGSPGSQKAI